MIVATLLIDILEVMGGIMIAYMVVMVHHRVKQEQQINDSVVTAMKRERIVAFVGIGCLVVSLILRIITVMIIV